MASLVKRKEKGRVRYYLKYSSRENPRQRYLGTEIPKDIDQRLADFELRCYREDKGAALQRIRENYSEYVRTADRKVVADRMHGFKINHTYSTQRIEGSAMTLGQTRKLLELDLSPKDAPVEDILEARQLAELFDQMTVTRNADVSKRLILSWHDKLFQKTDTNNAGSFRRQDVQPYMGRTEYALWCDVEDEMSGLTRWYDKEKRTMNPVELAARFHSRFEIIHPFIDGNGRIGRLLVLFVLDRNSYPMLDIGPKEKHTYINKLESAYLQKDELIFVKWFVSKYLRDNKKFLGSGR